MRRTLIQVYGYLKGILILLRPDIFLRWLMHPLLITYNMLSLTKWIGSQNKKNIFNDFYSFKRDSTKRYALYKHVVDTLSLNDEPIDYLEFGVFEGLSFKWWVAACSNSNSRFYGFDTFEGLPEKWGLFSKGEMTAGYIPQIDDTRVKFEKGLFQETVPNFLLTHNLRNGKRKIIHLDADLFSSTLYALTSLGPFLKKGDVLMFDEFNVPNHEFFAYKIFSDAYYIKTKLIAAANNYYQVALVIE
jgi:O-methyltransferase